MEQYDYKTVGLQNICVFASLLKTHTKTLPISDSEFALLLVLHNMKKNVTPLYMSKILNISKARVSKMCSSLQSQGYLYKEISIKDKRSTYLKATPLGKELVIKEIDSYFEIWNYLISKMGFGNFIEMMNLLESANTILFDYRNRHSNK